jgi:ElaB/YqjD/DUF883 family membrane-anchored ribosome-binding protein
MTEKSIQAKVKEMAEQIEDLMGKFAHISGQFERANHTLESMLDSDRERTRATDRVFYVMVLCMVLTSVSTGAMAAMAFMVLNAAG